MRRGKQRWSALVSAPTSRLAAYMRDRLGDVLWSDFVRYIMSPRGKTPN